LHPLAVIAFCLAALCAAAKPIKLRNQTIEPSREATAHAADSTPQKGLFLIQLSGPADAESRAQLTSLGIELLHYVPEDAFVARLKNVPPGQVRRLPFVHWMGRYRPDHKVHQRVAQAVDAPPVSVLLGRGATPNEIAGAKRAFRKVQQESHSRLGTVLRGQLAPGQLQALAQSDSVLWIEPAPKMKLFDEIATDIVGGSGGEGTSHVHDLGYTGANVTVSVADSGLHTGNAPGMHPDLAGRVTAFFHYGELTDASDEHSHGTHCAGIVAGSGVIGEADEAGNVYGLGVAPGANIIAQRIFDGLGGYHAPGSFEQLTRDAVTAGADIASNSWGEDTQGRYDLSAAEFDALVRDADAFAPGDQPYIIEFSAGNAGPGAQTIGTPAVAKNVIATGAAQNNRFDFFIYDTGQEAMADFSSRGPAEDGRIKPDITAPGTWIASLRSALADDENAWSPISDNYLYQGGTSQAGPHVSGGGAVFVQYYKENYDGAKPSPALVKAALINSAVDMDDTVETPAVPNNDEGWGRMDLVELIDSTRTYEFLDQTVLLRTGQLNERRLFVGSSDEPLKITLTYTDVPGFPGAIPALVNDLDLEVVGPDGRVYRGNQFDEGESVPDAIASDSINNVEGVHLFEPMPGEYSVRVRARNVPDDARNDTASIDQDFALVISASILPPTIGAIFFDRSEYTALSRIRVSVIDTDLAGSPSVTVNLRSTTESAGETVVLRASGNNGVFTNSVATITGAAVVDGRLQIAHGDVIEATYQDASAAVTRTATAAADLIGPVITNVAVTNRFGRAVITWTTDEYANGRVFFGTNVTLGQVATGPFELSDHEIGLVGLIPGRTYFFKVASTDVAGNARTNDNAGALYSFVAPSAPTVLLVDAFFNDLFFDPPPPVENYTDALDQIGIDYEVWDASVQGSPALADLQPFRIVIWRLPEFSFTQGTFTTAERTAITNYLNGGGALFVASMEVLSRLDEAGGTAFRQNVLQVPVFDTDATVSSADGINGDPITDGLSLLLDYDEHYASEFNFSDTITPSTNAAPILIGDTGGYAGLRYPRTGFDSPGRLVFLSFPFDTIPADAPAPNNRAELMRRIITFLAPGLGGVASVALDKGSYTVPSVVTVEVADSDLAGAGQMTVSAANARTGNSISVTLHETPRAGSFRGTFTIESTGSANSLAGLDGDAIHVTYFDASRGQAETKTAVVDTQAPVISGRVHEADYVSAIISWDTSESTDALVQYGESAFLGRTVYDGEFAFGHELQLVNLAPDQTYYYRVVSRDEAGNTTIDDNGGNLYTFRTLRPLMPPWIDNLDGAASTNWTVIDGEDTQATWTLGVPDNGWETAAQSPANAWGSNLDGSSLDQAESFLVGPAIHLSGGNRATLRFWHSYDFTERSEFDIIEGGEVLLITNVYGAPITLAEFAGDATSWEEIEIDLTPYSGQLVYVVFHYVIFSLEPAPRPGWLVDDVSITMESVTPGLVVVTNNLFQARFTVTGPVTRAGSGNSLRITNAPPGTYSISYNAVPYCNTPAPQNQTLAAGGTVTFTGNYTFADANANGMSDAWETDKFSSVSPTRTATTDTDGDGVTDLKEFQAGTDPNAAGSHFTIASSALLPDGKLRLQWPTMQGRGYRAEGSANGIDWTAVSSWTIAPGLLLTHDVPAWTPGAPFLFRIEVRP
jgi:hypothetical protein